VPGIVITGAGIFSPQPLQQTVKSQIGVCDDCNTE